MTLNGQGDQFWMTNQYEDKRRKALKDRSKYNIEKLTLVDVSGNIAEGGGRTLDSTYEIKQFPYPVDQSIRRKKTVDLRDVDPTIGGR